jgi:hypothetical protein
MTERRATNPPEQGVAALRAGSSPDGAIDVAIEEGAPESPKPVVKVPSAAPSSQRVGGAPR